MIQQLAYYLGMTSLSTKKTSKQTSRLKLPMGVLSIAVLAGLTGLAYAEDITLTEGEKKEKSATPWDLSGDTIQVTPKEPASPNDYAIIHNISTSTTTPFKIKNGTACATVAGEGKLVFLGKSTKTITIDLSDISVDSTFNGTLYTANKWNGYTNTSIGGTALKNAAFGFAAAMIANNNTTGVLGHGDYINNDILSLKSNTTLTGIIGPDDKPNLKVQSSDSTMRTLTLTGDRECAYAGVLGTSSNPLSLVREGSGKQTLSGTTTLTNLTLNNGSLVLNGATTVSGVITLAAKDTPVLTLGNTLTLGDSVTLAITTEDTTIDDTTSYQLFKAADSGTLAGTMKVPCTVNGVDKGFATIATDGAITFTGNVFTTTINASTKNYSEISWGDVTSKPSSEDTITLNFTEDCTFTFDDTCTVAAIKVVNNGKTVTLEKGPEATITCEAYEFSNATESTDGTTKLAFDTGAVALVVNADATLELAQAEDTTLSGNVTVAGALKLSGATTVTLSGKLSGPGNVTIASGATLELAQTADTTFAGPVAVEGTLKRSGGSGNVTLSGVVSGAGDVSVVSGILTLATSNTISGNTSIAEGSTLAISNVDALGSGTITGAGTLASSAGFPTNTTGLTATTWTGTLKFTGGTTVALGGKNLNAYGNADSTIEVDTGTTCSGNLADSQSCSSALIINGTFEETQGIYTFNGKLTGTGELKVPANSTYMQLLTFTGDCSGFNGAITVAGSRCVMFGSGTAESGTIIVASGVTVSIVTGKTWTAATAFKIDGTLNIASAGALSSGTIKGSGTLASSAGFPSNKTGLTATAWTGTLKFTNNLTLSNSAFGSYGNSNSIIEFAGDNNTGTFWNGTAGGSADARLCISGKLTTSGGGYTFKGGLSGAGTLIVTGTSLQTLKFPTSEFMGSINVQGNRCVMFGSGTAANGTIVVASDATVSIASGKTWTAATAFNIDGTLNIASAGALGDSGTIKGAGTLSSAAGFPTNTTGLNATAWTGTLKLTGGEVSNKALSAYGNSGSTIQFETSEADSCTLTGDFTTAGNLTVSDKRLAFATATSPFNGVIAVKGAYGVTIGGTACEAGAISVASNNTVNIVATKTWSAENGIKVAGTLGGTGTLDGDVTFEQGATLDASEGPVTVQSGKSLTLNSSVTTTLPTTPVAETYLIKCDSPTPSDALKFACTTDTALCVAPVITGTTGYQLVVAPTVTVPTGVELPDGQEKEIQEVAAANGITEDVTLNAKNSQGDVKEGMLECFEGGTALTADPTEKTVSITYDFGITTVTPSKVMAKVQGAKIDGVPGAATFKDGVTLTLLQQAFGSDDEPTQVDGTWEIDQGVATFTPTAGVIPTNKKLTVKAATPTDTTEEE